MNTVVDASASTATVWSVTRRRPTNFTGARTITGHFTGTGPQDFLVYYAGAPNPGSGMVIRSPGDGSALKPQYNGNEYNLSAGLLQDIDGLNPVQLANAGNASGQGLAYPDLIAVNGDSTYGYRLTYYASQNGVLNFQFPASLTNLTPTGGTDWNSWRITSAQVAGGTALYLWNTSTGALYLWTALAYNLETQVLSYTSHTIAASGWNAGAAGNSRPPTRTSTAPRTCGRSARRRRRRCTC